MIDAAFEQVEFNIAPSHTEFHESVGYAGHRRVVEEDR